MSSTGVIKSTDKAIKTYYQSLDAYSERQVTHEGAIETAFQRLLADTAKLRGWAPANVASEL
ncbi:MAG: hypothetical protein HY000_31090 [Planctomycetes bacterium]|nr:hypothetical protein [Planctomycetota bacterium]